MAFLAKGKKQDLIILASELNVEIDENFKIIDLKNAITKSVDFDEEFTKELLDTIIKERKENEELLIQHEREQRAFELEKIKLQNVNGLEMGSNITTSNVNYDKIEIKGILPSFDPNTDDISVFLNLFESQLTFLKVPETKWVVYLIGLLPIEIAKLIAIETNSQENPQEYGEVKKVLLRRFKVSAEKFRQLFVQHKKKPDSTWRDFFYEIKTYFDGWLNELNITDFQQLKDLMISDQIKKKCPPDYKEHFLDHWSDWNDPTTLIDKLDSYEEIRNLKGKNSKLDQPKNEIPKYRSNSDYKNYKSNVPQAQYKFSTSKQMSNIQKKPISCYGCGKAGFIKAKCPTCSPVIKVDSAQVSSLKFQTCTIQEPETMLLKIKINGMYGVACADTGASHTVAGEVLYNLLREQGIIFDKVNLNVTLADGLPKYSEVYKTDIFIEIMGKNIKTTLFALPTAKNNRTLLGTDFLSKAGISLDIQHKKWYFNSNPRKKFPFEKNTFVPPCETSNEQLKSLNESQVDEVVPFNENNVTTELNTFVLKENKGKHLTADERLRLRTVLETYADVFQPGEEPRQRRRNGSERGSMNSRSKGGNTQITSNQPVSTNVSNTYDSSRDRERDKPQPNYQCCNFSKQFQRNLPPRFQKQAEYIRQQQTRQSVVVAASQGSQVHFMRSQSVGQTPSPTSTQYPVPAVRPNAQSPVQMGMNYKSGWGSHPSPYVNQMPGISTNVSKGLSRQTSKLIPHRNGPHYIMSKQSPTTYLIPNNCDPLSPIGKFHASCLQPYTGETSTQPETPLRKRGRPPAVRKEEPVRRSPRFQPATRGRNVAG